jgi:hypothetical protein
MNELITRAELTIPSLGPLPEIVLDLSSIKDGESRLKEAQIVSSVTYGDLSYVFNEGYRQAKQHLSSIGFQINMTDKEIRRIKAEFLLDEYQTFLKDKKIKDSASIRDAYLEKQKDYVDAMDRLAMLKATESMMEGKIKVFENTCQYMRKLIDLEIRSGVDSNHYSRIK